MLPTCVSLMETCIVRHATFLDISKTKTDAEMRIYAK